MMTAHCWKVSYFFPSELLYNLYFFFNIRYQKASKSIGHVTSICTKYAKSIFFEDDTLHMNSD